MLVQLDNYAWRVARAQGSESALELADRDSGVVVRVMLTAATRRKLAAKLSGVEVATNADFKRIQ